MITTCSAIRTGSLEDFKEACRHPTQYDLHHALMYESYDIANYLMDERGIQLVNDDPMISLSSLPELKKLHRRGLNLKGLHWAARNREVLEYICDNGGGDMPILPEGIAYKNHAVSGGKWFNITGFRSLRHFLGFIARRGYDKTTRLDLYPAHAAKLASIALWLGCDEILFTI